MAAARLQALGLEEGDAGRLAAAMARNGISSAADVDAHLAKFAALKAPLSAQDWATCFGRCHELLALPPQLVGQRLGKLRELVVADEQQLVSCVLKAPTVLQHDPQDIASKVVSLQSVMALPDEEASAQLIIERFSRYPAILARSVEALEAQLSGLAGLLGCDLQRAARLAFKVPALAAASNEELQSHMELLCKLLALDMATARALVLRQPSLLARTTEGLQAKIDAYRDMFGQEHLGQALAAAPQLLTMKVEAVRARYDLLTQLARLQPAWTQQLQEASHETLAVWLCSSEKKLRRLEAAAANRKLSRLQLYRILSHSEGRWANELAAAGAAAGSGGGQAGEIGRAHV